MPGSATSEERSVLEDIRSAIRSLDALRGRRGSDARCAVPQEDTGDSDAFVACDVASSTAAFGTTASGTAASGTAASGTAASGTAASGTADVTNADVTNADVTNADVTNADVTNADVTNADVTNSTVTGVGTPAPSESPRADWSLRTSETPMGGTAESEAAPDRNASQPQVSIDAEPTGDADTEPDDLDSSLFSSTDRLFSRTANKNAKIMIVDDEPLNIMTFRQHLKMEGYENFVTTDKATQALTLIRREKPDIVLLDIRMPEVSGIDILRVIGLDPQLQHIPVLILTAATDPRIRKKALELGASDFLSKPVDPSELLPRVRNAIVLKQHYDMVLNEATRLEQQVERRTQQLEATRQQLILSLARAAEHRDDDTGNHVIRVGRYTSIIAHELGYPASKLSMLEQAAQLHDVGKIGIPDSILFKPGKLEPDQFELMKKHCALGKQIIEPIAEKEWNILKTHTRRGESLLHVRSSPLLMLAARIAQTHHEKWNGSGYPLGLSGEDIPLEGRIVAVADVFDALSSARPYKPPFSREKSFRILEEGRGTHFDPRVLDAFFARANEIIETQLLLMDATDRITGPAHVDDGHDTPLASNDVGIVAGLGI